VGIPGSPAGRRQLCEAGGSGGWEADDRRVAIIGSRGGERGGRGGV